MNKIIKNDDIEALVRNRFQEYEGRNGVITSYKIPVEDIIIDAGLNVEYDEIEEKPGEKFLAGLNVETKSIIINSKHLRLFKEKPGLERSSMGHELGHWDIFEKNKMNGDNITFEFYENSTEIMHRASNTGKRCIVVNIWVDDDVYKVVKKFERKKDHPYVASAVDRYANYLLLPTEKVLQYSEGVDLTVWRNLYGMTEAFDVTISSLSVRLQRMGLIFIKDRIIYNLKIWPWGNQHYSEYFFVHRFAVVQQHQIMEGGEIRGLISLLTT